VLTSIQNKEWAGSSDGRASALQAGGHRFESCSAYQEIQGLSLISLRSFLIFPTVFPTQALEIRGGWLAGYGFWEWISGRDYLMGNHP
jgi:hypothetical protein